MARFSLFSASTCKLDSVRTTAVAMPTSGSNQIPFGNQRIKKANKIADHLYSWLALAGKLRTASADYDDHHIDIIKEVLATT